MVIKTVTTLVAPDIKYQSGFVEALKEGFSMGSSPILLAKEIADIKADFQ